MNQSFDGYIVFSADLLTVQAQIAEKRGGDFPNGKLEDGKQKSFVYKAEPGRLSSK